jgi:hypothetical protein
VAKVLALIGGMVAGADSMRVSDGLCNKILLSEEEYTDDRELVLTGKGGFLPEMINAVLERGLGTELSSHLGNERGDPARARQPELAQRDHPEDPGHRGRGRATGSAAGPGLYVRAPPGSEGRPANWCTSCRQSPAPYDLCARRWPSGSLC